ncbi:MAG: uracil-DNA glycosylase [Gemmatimonadetes bacterium]|nr:MAG: uracil-DNA glycosylase [Gemmatimonadota bacterium]
MPRVRTKTAGDEVWASAVPYLPRRLTLPALRKASEDCHGCPLYRTATQTVFGQGQTGARIMFVGEQPGDMEDKQGAPFVGPAGRVLNEALAAAGIDRDDAYVTNVVKHFKWIAVHRRRMHKKPNAREVAACLPWLEKELEVVQPRILVCLGATAAQALLGPDVRVTRDRGHLIPSRLAPQVMATVHPSSILRQQTSEDRHREMELFTQDLRVVAQALA